MLWWFYFAPQLVHSSNFREEKGAVENVIEVII